MITTNYSCRNSGVRNVQTRRVNGWANRPSTLLCSLAGNWHRRRSWPWPWVTGRRLRNPLRVTSGARYSNPTVTPREKEIAELVAAGKTNKEIAQDLVISQRTVDSRVEHILMKLGLTSRTKLAVLFATDQVTGPASVL